MMLLEDVHRGLPHPADCDKVILCSGYTYYHYLCGEVDDRGWGCGYRTLQSLCSWISCRLVAQHKVPSIEEIQRILVVMGDKDEQFLGSKQWIGSVEVGLVIDKLYDVPCKIVHVQSGSQLSSHLSLLQNHFTHHKSPIMMGGESDTSSKGIIGLATSPSGSIYLLVLDPHYFATEGKKESISCDQLQTDDWVKWININSLHQDTFYNLCLPQAKHLPDKLTAS